jgi:hypothetical protein
MLALGVMTTPLRALVQRRAGLILIRPPKLPA